MAARLPVLRRVAYGGLAFNILGEFKENYDVLPEEQEKAARAREEAKTGHERLRQMFSLDEFGTASMEVQQAKDTALMGFFFGGCVGAFMSTRSTYVDFVEQNEATRFHNMLDAQKKLQDKMTVSLGKGFWRWGWRIGLFSGTFMLVRSSVARYRNKHGFVEYIAAGSATGVLYRMNIGIRGAVVGAILGGALGGVAGGLTLGIMKLTGVTMEDMEYWQRNWKDAKRSETELQVRQRRATVLEPLMIDHDLIISETQKPPDTAKESSK